MLTVARVKNRGAEGSFTLTPRKIRFIQMNETYGPKPQEMKHNDLIGSPAVPFVLKDASGRPHSFEQYQGRWLLLVFLRHLG
ncbi:hypothetical protein [Desulfofustis limnaeus]|uniref:Alkyl hydroperoxide reductase subunit C/ Thiol specific antioxidant domain-containing protein n=1 Tax=Desulfofustis limnaeus TaxID=2740163 RepID=A0ABM7W7L7_9BACT|nr:hypothetical protein [Desulfofustis limnaeus]BDD86990.1 hypothetical protein DPPLL_13550 [Desulfofustis limnaeus]